MWTTKWSSLLCSFCDSDFTKVNFKTYFVYGKFTENVKNDIYLDLDGFVLNKSKLKMDKNYVKSTLEGLKSTSSTRVQETLLKIRSKIINNDEGIKLFRQSGGLDYLLPHLRKPNERILDITLSILGNCCLEEESSIAVSYNSTLM